VISDTILCLSAQQQQEMIQAVFNEPLTDAEKDQVKTIHFDVNQYREPQHSNRLLKLIIFMFTDLGLLTQFDVAGKKFVRFLLAAHGMYRNVHYHSFYHAFDATHFMYLMIRMLSEDGTPEDQRLTPLEQFAAMVTALLHDVDHMGLNNSYHVKADTPYGILYTASGIPSVLETHHCNRAIQLLSCEQTEIFSTLSSDQKGKAYRVLVELILATDMAKHKTFTLEMRDCLGTGSVPQMLILKMLMKTADLSNVCKPFPIAKYWASAITEEFFYQGDLEKAEGLDVTPMLDRFKNTELAKNQLSFIGLVMEHYTVLAQWNPRFKVFLNMLQSNQKRWQAMQADADDANKPSAPPSDDTAV
jgi:cAMP-specific phosphodiesterase